MNWPLGVEHTWQRVAVPAGDGVLVGGQEAAELGRPACPGLKSGGGVERTQSCVRVFAAFNMLVSGRQLL